MAAVGRCCNETQRRVRVGGVAWVCEPKSKDTEAPELMGSQGPNGHTACMREMRCRVTVAMRKGGIPYTVTDLLR